MDPMISREIIKSQQLVPVFGKALHSTRMLGYKGFREFIHSPLSQSSGIGFVYVMEHAFGFSLRAFWELVEHIARLVHPAALMFCIWVLLAQGCPKSKSAIPNPEFRSKGKTSFL